MKRSNPVKIIIIFAALTLSCSDKFLSDNEIQMYELSDTLYLNSSQSEVETSISLPVPTNNKFTINMQPRWLSFSSMHGTVISGEIPLSFTIKKERIPSGIRESCGNIMIGIEGLGVVVLTVVYADYGSPTLHYNPTSLSFETGGSKNLTITNSSEGILNWRITEIPGWLTLSDTTGSLSYGNSETINVSINQNVLTPGMEYSGSFLIVSNSISGGLTSIQVSVAASATIPPEEIIINGNVTDAVNNKERGIILIGTKEPNSLIVYNTFTKTSSTIPLGKTPNCISISEDGLKAVIGFTVASVAYFDINSLTITNEFPVDCIPYDIVTGGNGWCYITPVTGQWVTMRNLNLNTGELVKGAGLSNLYEKTIIRKVPGKARLVGTRTNLSPTGILIFDISNGKANEVESYYHTSTGNMWISADGTRLFDSYKNVYMLPEYDGQYHTDAPPVFGQVTSAQSLITGYDDCTNTNSFFAIYADNYYSSGYTSVIEQFNSTNLNRERVFYTAPVNITENGLTTNYETCARFLFVNKDGDNLYVVKNLKEKYSKSYWTIEVIHP